MTMAADGGHRHWRKAPLGIHFCLFLSGQSITSPVQSPVLRAPRSRSTSLVCFCPRFCFCVYSIKDSQTTDFLFL
ncbi:hypothetical protein F5X68DRAFT_203153, partial [Plectosphaerella plurivora]